jgi:hypothetical protein
MQEDAEKLFQEKRKDLVAPQILNHAYNTSYTHLQTLLNHERKQHFLNPESARKGG